jgi:Na+/H+ antiporter NhaD/arsenite permease-like protein
MHSLFLFFSDMALASAGVDPAHVPEGTFATASLLKFFGVEYITQQTAQYVAVAVFLTMFAAIAGEVKHHVNKMYLSFGAAAFLLLVGFIDLHQAWAMQEANILLLLVGMMLVIVVLERTRIFDLIAHTLIKRSGGDLSYLLWAFSFTTGFTSMGLDNVTTVLVMTPAQVKTAIKLGKDPRRYVINLAQSSNECGAATLIGDPPNPIIAKFGNKSFMDFIWSVLPFVWIGWLAGQTVTWWQMKRAGLLDQSLSPDELQELLDEQFAMTEGEIRNAKIAGSVFGMALICFGFAHSLGIEVGVIAITAAIITLVLTSPHNPAHVLEKVEWGTIGFFMGLFIVVGYLQLTGVFGVVSERLVSVIGNDMVMGFLLIGVVGAVASAIVDNIPFVMAFSFVLQAMGEQLGVETVSPLWWALCIGACLGGNITLIGTSAGVVSSDKSNEANRTLIDEGKPGFGEINFAYWLQHGALRGVVSTSVALLTAWVWHMVL